MWDILRIHLSHQNSHKKSSTKKPNQKSGLDPPSVDTSEDLRRKYTFTP